MKNIGNEITGSEAPAGESPEDTIFAHVRQDQDGGWAEPHFLLEHLEGTAAFAKAFGAKFGADDWAEIAGFAHDLGKARAAWQQYLRKKSGFSLYDVDAHLENKPGKMPHAIHGAFLAEKLFGKPGRILAYCIAGHHAGLPDWTSENIGRSSLEFQLRQPHLTQEVTEIPDFVLQRIHAYSKRIPKEPPRKFVSGLDFSLWVRMLYSSLVDADFLDTEAYMDSHKASKRGVYASIDELLVRFNTFIRQFEEKPARTPLNIIRKNIRIKCQKMAQEPQGVFSLSVPTGGGKTLSSLSFGLEHAKTHGLDRVIYVVPYTSIIEQNADVFRNALGSDAVVEHHSNIAEGDQSMQARLASENWDAPVIVTTAVQFFESLFAAKPSRCRKLHNICNSVVILDEAQLIPVEYLDPILETLQLLVNHYRVSIIISTATQPAFRNKLNQVREIVGDEKVVDELYQKLERVKVELPDNFTTRSDWKAIAGQLSLYNQVLCIVSDRKSCRELHGLMPEGTFHLSALMCGQHRSEVIQNIKKKLLANMPVRVISTQLVEAGVDLDFPVVYRALAGLDSIAQAAGRCNREGKLYPDLGKLVVFVPPKASPAGILRKAFDTTCGILKNSKLKPLDHRLFDRFFSELYWKANSLDSKGIRKLLTPTATDLAVSFRTAAATFKIIDESNQRTIFVKYGLGEEIIANLKVDGPSRHLLRKLQRYSVNVYEPEFRVLLNAGVVEEVWPDIFAMTSSLHYSNTVGLILGEVFYDPEHCIF